MGGKRGNWMKGVKGYKLPVIESVSTRDVMYSMVTLVHTAVWIFESEENKF